MFGLFCLLNALGRRDDDISLLYQRRTGSWLSEGKYSHALEMTRTIPRLEGIRSPYITVGLGIPASSITVNGATSTG